MGLRRHGVGGAAAMRCCEVGCMVVGGWANVCAGLEWVCVCR
jgi:hypothetical protein